jgi:UPF0755 protein
MNLESFRKIIFNNKTEVFLGICLTILIIWVYMTTVPRLDNVTLVNIEEGESLKTISEKLAQEKIIRSQAVFNALIIFTGKDNNIVAGEYEFEKAHSIFEISKRITTGDYGIELKKVTLTEGMTVQEMADYFESTFPKFNRDLFERDTSNLEGYLFPDTYIFPINAENELILNTILDNFEAQIDSISKEIKSSPYTLEQIIIMASIVEKEATKESREDVANILWGRFEEGMALQVDAPFVYERGKGSFDLYFSDLENDSPYNTYTRVGLTPTPISNPGLESIKAAATPEETPYVFFLTGLDGEMYYAETFDQHKENKAKYLR